MRGPTSEKSLCTISCERSSESAWRRACRSPRRPSVIICSANGFTAFAFASVVLMRPCSIREHARFAYSAFRCAGSRPSFLPVRAWRMTLLGASAVAERAAAVAAEREPVLRQRLLDFFDRLLAEVRDRSELVLGLHDEIADGFDTDALEAVVRADAELELLDREVLHPAREPGLGADTVTGDDRLLAEALHLVDVGEDRELGRRLDVGGGDDARPLLRDVHLDLGRIAVQARHEVLEVEHDVGDVLANARQGRELVRSALDLDRGDRCALERREQHAAQRVAERMTEAAVERLDLKHPAMLVHFLVDDARNLKVHCPCSQRDPFFSVTW